MFVSDFLLAMLLLASQLLCWMDFYLEMETLWTGGLRRPDRTTDERIGGHLGVTEMCLWLCKWHVCFSGHVSCCWMSNINERGLGFVQEVLLFVWNVHVSLCEVSLLQTCSGCAANSLFFIFFPPLSEALGTINPTDYSAPLLLD